MKVAALYDIHGNLPALKAVLRELEPLAVDQIVIGGDAIVGPMSKECLDVLMAIAVPVHYIKGNCETSVLDHANNRPLPPLPQKALESISWTASQLGLEHKKFITDLPLTFLTKVQGLGTVLFCHATPRNEFEIFTKQTAADKLAPIFDSLGVDMVVCGHTHMQFDKTIGNTRIINAGSVGMHFGKTGAHWLLLDSEVELRCTHYDLEIASEVLCESSYPDVKTFVENNVINPPSEKTMLEVFSKSELT